MDWIAMGNPYLRWSFAEAKSILAPLFRFPAAKDHRIGDGRFLMIVGAGRSGNTLLRRLLMERYSIFIPPETYALSAIADYRLRGRALPWRGVVNLVLSSFEYRSDFFTFKVSSLRELALEIKDWPLERQKIAHIIHRFYHWLAQQSAIEYTWVGDKTPLNTLSLGPIQKVVPRSKYIFLIRDGADVAASYVNASLYDDIGRAGQRWVNSYDCWRVFKSRLDPSSYIELRYEDLVASPEDHVRHIASKFGIPGRQALLDVSGVMGDSSEYAHHSNVARAPSVNSIGKGRKGLSSEQRLVLAPLMNSTLSRLGYEKL